VDNGADSIAIKDMAGLLHPYDAFELIESLRKEFPNLQLTLHSHCTNGLANVSYLVGMMLGVDYVDTCYGPMAAATSQPSIELMQMFAKELGLQTNVEMGNAAKIDEELRKIRKELSAVDKDPEHMGNPWPAEPDQKMRDRVKKTVELVQKRDKDSIEQAMSIIEDELLPEQGYPKIDRAQLGAQIPGGMISNLHNQLKDQGKLEEMPKILEEVPKVRADAGYVPLVTPTSQIVGTQAAFNVLQGSRYTFASQPFKDLLAGKYGRLPGPPNTEVQQKVLAGQEVAMGRPADYAPRVDLEAVYAEHGKIIKSHRDLLLMVLFPAAAKKFLAERNGQASG
jgi:pyruvate/oxaloacetate carboxyltransferase